MRACPLLATLRVPAVAAAGGDLLEVALVLVLFFVAAFVSMVLALVVAWIARRRATRAWVQASGITLALGVLTTGVIGGGAMLVGVHMSAALMVIGPGALSLLLASRLHQQAKAALRAQDAPSTH